jgi:hypothetical protein
MLAEHAAGSDGVASLRVRQGAGFHDWLLTHLTLTLVRMKTVVVEGEVVRRRRGGAERGAQQERGYPAGAGAR